MILVKIDSQDLGSDIIVNLEKCQGIRLDEDSIIFDLNEHEYYRKTYDSEKEAQDAFNKLFTELAGIQGVDGAVLD